MGAGRFEHEPADGSLRLVPQPDGYADYVDPGRGADLPRDQARSRHSLGRHALENRPGHAGRRRGERAPRQRSIRSTITILLVIPLLSLVALWVYAATSTVGGAIAKRDADQSNASIGAPIESLIQQIDTERADTYVWQSAQGRLSKSSLLAQRPKTNAAVAAFRTAAAAVSGLEPAADQPVLAALLAKLNQLGAIRDKVDAGTIAPLTAFQDYNAVADAIYPYVGAQDDPSESVQLYQESQAALQEGQATDDIGQEAALVGGALAAGGRMSAADLRTFTATVDNQRLLEQMGSSPLDWQESPDPYPRVLATGAFAGFTQLEDKIIASQPGAPLPVSPAAWQSSVESVISEFTAAETTARLGITKGDTEAGDLILLRLILVGGAGLIAVVMSSFLLLRFGNRISRELTGLRGAALALAGERLPSVVRRLRGGEDVDAEAEAPPLALRTRTREVTETAAAFSSVQRTAVEAAVEQARLRKGVSLIFRSLARRNQSLLQRQLKMLDEMEHGAEDPELLAQLFRLDHLTTRMRRQAEGLIILSGAPSGRAWRQPVRVVEVLRGALGEIEDFARVDLVTDSPDFLEGAGVADVTHLLAELIENAVLYSPPGMRVQVRCGRVANGYTIEIEDHGLGIPDGTLNVLNDRLARPPEFDLADSDQLGLFVVSRLAARQGIKVSLRASAYGGALAIVLLPPSLVVSEEETAFLTATAQGPKMATPAAVPAGAAVRNGQPPLRAGHTGQPRRAQVAAASAAETGTGGLPKRQPMASMAPQLRESRSGAPKGPLAGRSPERARALLSSIRQGWQTGLSQGDDGQDEGSRQGRAGE